MKIAVAGAGYVGLSISMLLSQNNEVVIYDIDKEKIKKLNKNIISIEDVDIADFLKIKTSILLLHLICRKLFGMLNT